MQHKLPVHGFEWRKHLFRFDEELIQDYDEDTEKEYILGADVNYLNELHKLHSGLAFLPKSMKIGKCKKLVCNLYDMKDYVVYKKALRQSINHELILAKVHRVINFNQEAWLKQHIDMNTKLRTKAKNDFENDFFKLMNNAILGKTIENVSKHRDI